MGFMLVTLLVLGAMVGLLILVGRAYPGSGADLLDWKPTRSYETEAELELDDVQQMIEAQNEYRRRRGAEEITEEDVQRQAAEDEKVRQQARDFIEDEMGA